MTLRARTLLAPFSALVLLSAWLPTTAGAAEAPSSYTAVGGSPSALAVDSTTHRVFVTDYGSDRVSTFDGSLEHPIVTTVTAGRRPVALAIDETERSVFVANADSGTVSRFNADDPSPVADEIVTIDSPSSVTVDQATHTVYVTSSTLDRVFSFDGRKASPTLVSTAVGRAPSGVAVDAVSHLVAVTNSLDDTVSTFVPTLSSDPAGSGSAPSVTTIPVGASPSAIAIDSSTHWVVATNLRGNSVSRFDGALASPVVSTVAVGRAPASIAVDSRTHHAVIGNSLGETVSQFDVTNSSPPVMQLPLGKAPRGVAVDDVLGAVYASNPLNGQVSGRAPLRPSSSTITSEEPHVATVGTWFSHAFEATGTPAPTLSLSGAVPAGLMFDAVTGELSGTPTMEGTAVLTLTAHNGVGADAVQTVTMDVVQRAPSLTAGGALAAAKVGAAYSFRLAPAGSAPATCTVASGPLPGGVTLNAATCALSGRPAAAGSYLFEVTAKNSGGAVSAEYTLVVAPAGGTGCPAVAPNDGTGPTSRPGC